MAGPKLNWELKGDKIVYTHADGTVICTATYVSRNHYNMVFDKDIALEHFGRGFGSTVDGARIDNIPYHGLEYIALAAAAFYDSREG